MPGDDQLSGDWMTQREKLCSFLRNPFLVVHFREHKETDPIATRGITPSSGNALKSHFKPTKLDDSVTFGNTSKDFGGRNLKTLGPEVILGKRQAADFE
jgi:hypothetical protein